MQLVDNGGANKRWCPFCDNSGWVYLLRWEKRRAQNGSEYEEQVIAPCRMCRLGERRYSETRGPYTYRAEEVDVDIGDDFVIRLSPEHRDAYQRAKAGLARAQASRNEQLEIGDDPFAAMAERFRRGPGPGSVPVVE